MTRKPDSTLSMGCQVPAEYSCSLCAAGHEPRLVHDPREVGFFSISVVSAPRCVHCNTRMEAVSDTEWACVYEHCRAYSSPVHVGIYPIKRVKPGVDPP